MRTVNPTAPEARASRSAEPLTFYPKSDSGML